MKIPALHRSQGPCKRIWAWILLGLVAALHLWVETWRLEVANKVSSHWSRHLLRLNKTTKRWRRKLSHPFSRLLLLSKSSILRIGRGRLETSFKVVRLLILARCTMSWIRPLIHSFAIPFNQWPRRCWWEKWMKLDRIDLIQIQNLISLKTN